MLYAYQLIFMAVAFKLDRDRTYGGVCRDMAGIGKTRQSFSYYLLNLQHGKNVCEVEEEWAQVTAGTGPLPAACRHLPFNANPGSNLVCPTQADQALACWCVPENRVSLFCGRPGIGVQLTVTVPSAISTWADEANYLFQDAPLLNDKRWAPRIPMQYNNHGITTTEVTQSLTREEIASIARDIEWEQADSDMGNVTQRIGKEDVVGTITARYEGVQPRPRGTAAPGLEIARFMLVTTTQSLSKRVETPFKVRRVHRWTAEGRRVDRLLSSYDANALLVRTTVCDEYHEIHGGQQRPRWVNLFRHGYYKTNGLHMCVWGLSGTPNCSHPA
ncbi:hypothetical protein NX059_012147 [Plenodomus lindquistii]|nr:hypothetical protein NX059_012147 [Plenodomus lindquistii]